jgi:hypothetical protein
MSIEGIENAQKVRMIYIDDKTEQVFKSIAYATRITGVHESSIRIGLNPLKQRKFEYNNRIIVFRINK